MNNSKEQRNDKENKEYKFMVDDIFEPFMERYQDHASLTLMFGYGKGSGAAVTMFVLGMEGTLHCLIFGKKMKKFKYKDN